MIRYTDRDEWIPFDGLPMLVGRSGQAELCLSDPTVSRQHARLERRANQVWVVDLGSRHGTFVNGIPVREKAVSLKDLIQFGRRVQYRVLADGLERVARAGMEVWLEGVGLAVGTRSLLEGIHLHIPAGGFIGILGPSGAGKSMLLRMLAGVRQPTSGIIRTSHQDNIWDDIEEHRRHLAFIPQEDVLYNLLTLKEHLEFAADLRLGRSDEAQRQAMVKEALQMLGLEEHAEKLVGVLSGGQRKRLSVALEWLRKPDLLLLDEPTAGLDPANEARLMEQFAALAKRGSTVVCATHLMDNIRLFELVAVVARRDGVGTLAYMGSPEGLLPHFGCRHFADVYEKLESGLWVLDHSSAVQETSAPRTPRERVGAAMPPPPRPAVARHSLSDSGTSRGVSVMTATSVDKLVSRVVEAPWDKQLKVVMQRSALVLWRDRWLWAMMCAQPLVLAVLVGLIQFSPGRLTLLLFFSLAVACWLGMNNSIRDLVRDRGNYIRDRLAGLRPDAYLLGKISVFAGLGLAQIAVFLLLVRVLSRFILPEDLSKQMLQKNVLWWFTCLLAVYLCGLGLSLLVSTIVRTEEAAIAWLPILILLQILISSVASGVSSMSVGDTRPFRPIVVTIHHPTTAAKAATSQSDEVNPTGDNFDKLTPVAVAVDVVSLFVYTRPALVALMQESGPNSSSPIWLADFAHLLILLAATYMALWVAFQLAERHWLALSGY